MSTKKVATSTQHKFAPGDTVRLNSGGPLMTVGTLRGAFVNVSWFDIPNTSSTSSDVNISYGHLDVAEFHEAQLTGVPRLRD